MYINTYISIRKWWIVVFLMKKPLPISIIYITLLKTYLIDYVCSLSVNERSQIMPKVRCLASNNKNKNIHHPPKKNTPKKKTNIKYPSRKIRKKKESLRFGKFSAMSA